MNEYMDDSAGKALWDFEFTELKKKKTVVISGDVTEKPTERDCRVLF